MIVYVGDVIHIPWDDLVDETDHSECEEMLIVHPGVMVPIGGRHLANADDEATLWLPNEHWAAIHYRDEPIPNQEWSSTTLEFGGTR